MSESRVEQWKRKLLDLSLRNPLLNVRDGEKYASQHTVRDRDILRADVLKGMGWRLFRVWSVDWAFDRKRAEERLLAMLTKTTTNNKTKEATNDMR